MKDKMYEIDFPAMDVSPTRTSKGTPYLTEAGVVLLARTVPRLEGLRGFLDGFDPALGFDDYLKDEPINEPGAALVKVAGQICYMSFDANRTKNAHIAKYLKNVLGSGHGSVVEHPTLTFLLYGVSRSFTHELVRHRAGFAYSQVSQRYVDGRKLRFVMRPEFREDPKMIASFEAWIDGCAAEYDRRAEVLKAQQLDLIQQLEAQGRNLADCGISKTDLRKQVNQAARSCLPNETEAPIVVTANVRAWRHCLAMRGALAAEPEIRAVSVKLALCLKKAEPSLFEDVTIRYKEPQGFYVTLEYPKA